MKVRIKEQSWLAWLAARNLGTATMALTLGRTIHLHHTTKADFLADKAWVCHELAHVLQFRKYGFIPFLVRYTWESIKNGYRNNRWEVEARAAESNLSLLEQATFY